ncbi:MAG TPA: isoprenylcysteine carboxylmethyltransferase family protein [Stellaceae bacterium]|nr:isoprenylcysteine carboxylmethyltransferase family protein [Stellaceae bacterium]
MILRLVVQTTVWLAAMAVLLFLPAGRLDWPAAWVFMIENAAMGYGLGFWLARHDPALLAERLAPPIQRAQKRWDKIFLAAVMTLFILWLVTMGLDAGRWRWSSMPPWAAALGALLVLLTCPISYLTFRENSYAAAVVKVQKERGQKAVTTGPYRYVRHPLYAGALLYFIGAPLLLGSWLGLTLAPLLIAAIAWRAVMEERLLMAELDGYAAYATRVRWRLVPWIW